MVVLSIPKFRTTTLTAVVEQLREKMSFTTNIINTDNFTFSNATSNGTEVILNPWLTFNISKPPYEINAGLRYYYLSVQAIGYLGLPVASGGLTSIIILIVLLNIINNPLRTKIFGYMEIFADLALILFELVYKRYAPAAAEIFNFRDESKIDANAFSQNFTYMDGFNPRRNFTAIDCKVLAFSHNFVNAFRTNLILVVVCSRIGFYSLQNRTMTSIVNIFLGGLVAFMMALLATLPVVVVTEVWRVWNVTMCSFHPDMTYTIFEFLSLHQVMYCYGLVPAFFSIFLAQGLVSRNNQIKRSINYLELTFPQYTFIDTILTRIKHTLEIARDNFSSLLFYARPVAFFKVAVGLTQLYYYLMYKISAGLPLDYIHYCIAKNTVENFSCLGDVIILSFAPIWWYCNNARVRALFWKTWCCCCLRIGCSCSAIMSPEDAVIKESRLQEELEDIDGRVIKKILALRNRLLGRMMDLMTWEAIESLTAKKGSSYNPK